MDFSDNVSIQPFKFPCLNIKNELYIKREDCIHPLISGNKFWKLKYNIEEAKKKGKKILVTFGGAMSNHIVAVAAAGKENNFQTCAFIRGEELKDKWQENETLKQASDLGMQFYFISRSDYRHKENSEFVNKKLLSFLDYYLIPEGGTNSLAVKGASEILNIRTERFDLIVTAVGTGGTLSGLSIGAKEHQKILGFPVLKGAEFLVKDILQLTNKNNFTLNLNYHFGGYAKTSDKLINFINDFYLLNNIPLDPIYTGKMMYGLQDLLKNSQINTHIKILVIHTGGLQGIVEMNKKLQRKNKQNIIR